MAAKGIVRPERMPPTKGAAEEHSLRAYLTAHEWMTLQNSSLPNLFICSMENIINGVLTFLLCKKKFLSFGKKGVVHGTPGYSEQKLIHWGGFESL